jgi:hypothetical protein
MSSRANHSADYFAAQDLSPRELYNKLVDLTDGNDPRETGDVIKAIRKSIEFVCVNVANQAYSVAHPNLRIRRTDADDFIELFYDLCQKINMDGQDIWIRSIVRDGASRFRPGILNEHGEDNHLDLTSGRGTMEFGNMKLEHGRQAFRSLFVGASAKAVGESTDNRGPATLYPAPVDQSSIDAWAACVGRGRRHGIVGHDTKVIVEGLGIDTVHPKKDKARADEAAYPIWKLRMDDKTLHQVTEADFSEYEAACTHCLDAGQAHLCEDRIRWMDELRNEYGFVFPGDQSR